VCRNLEKAKFLWNKRHSALRLLRQLGFLRFAKEVMKLGLLTFIGHQSMGDAFAALLERRRFSKVQVLFISSNPTSPSNPYRIANPKKVFEKNGFITRVVHPAFLESKDFLPPSLKIIWMYRASFDGAELTRLLKQSGNGVAVVYDNDDLTFDSQHYSPFIIPGLRALNRVALERVLSDIPNQRELIKQATHVSASTSFLLEKMGAVNPNSECMMMGNFLTDTMSDVAFRLDVTIRNKKQGDEFKIVYASGSSTHQRDFGLAWPQTVEFLIANPKANLTIIGHSPISWHDVPPRIRPQVQITNTYTDQETLLLTLSNYDLNLAPLDTSIDFNHAKSALKVIHAAAAGVRTLASYTSELEGAIKKLDSGQCVSEDGWLDGLERELLLHLQGGNNRRALQSKTLQIYGFKAYEDSFSKNIESIEQWRLLRLHNRE
jgi:hypothetical protein